MRRAFGLVEILVVLVMLAILAAVLYPRIAGGGKTSDGKDAPTPMNRARQTVCMTNLRSVRQMIEAHKAGDPDGGNPPSLDALQGLPRELKKCDMGPEPYRYDPQTGQVHCTHPGHENF
jgi:prepilin-type N-terminal cleavage/methylation domain-containing protein